MKTDELNINLFAQDRMDEKSILDWFNNSPDQEQKGILELLYWFITNSKPKEDEIDKAVIDSRLKPTITPCLLIKKNPINIAIPKIIDLPKRDRLKSFRLLLEVFKISDRRRYNESCLHGCSHEWHNIE
jgi:hypothetical protein